MHTCGRMTKAKTPCKNQGSYNGLIPCSTHMTEQDRVVSEALHRSWESGHKSGVESGRQSLKWEIEQEIRLEEKKSNTRFKSLNGNQIVQCGRYAYEWAGAEPLKVGDSVLLPGSWFDSSAWEAEVTELGSDYTGSMSNVIRKVA